jgi:hypothetical protein
MVFWNNEGLSPWWRSSVCSGQPAMYSTKSLLISTALSQRDATRALTRAGQWHWSSSWYCGVVFGINRGGYGSKHFHDRTGQFNGTFLVDTRLYEWMRWVVPLMIKLLLFFAIYSWIPRNSSILLKARLIGALVAAGLWELATRALSWALATGFTNFEPVYAHSSSIIALMTWMYLTGYIVFLGAHLTHALNYHFVD